MKHRWVLTKPKEPLRLVPVAERPLAPGEVRLRLEACGLGLLDWNVAMLDALPLTPLPLGAEAVGRVIEAGPGVTLATGQRVGVTPLASTCGRCVDCQGGFPAQCEAARWHGLHVEGALAREGCFAAQHLVPLPDELEPTRLAAVLGSGWTALAAVEALGPGPQRVGVLGLGGMGHQVALHARAAGHDVRWDEVEPARRAWAAACALQPWGDSEVDACVVATPSQQGLQRALRRVGRGGLVVLAAHAHATRIDVSLGEVVARRLRLEGVFLGRRATLERAVGAVLGGEIVPAVHAVPFDAAGDALYALRDLGFPGRLVVDLR